MRSVVRSPEAYAAWQAVMQHVQGGLAEKMTGRALDYPPMWRRMEKYCVDFQENLCRRGSACKFLHEVRFEVVALIPQ